jgi:hypothetical protein
MRDHEDQLSSEVARIASGQAVTDSPRPPKDRGHAQALARCAPSDQGSREPHACALPAGAQRGIEHDARRRHGSA